MMPARGGQAAAAVAGVAIVALVVLECFALSRGINGTLFTLVVAAVAGLGGFEVSQALRPNSRPRPGGGPPEPADDGSEPGPESRA